MRVYYAMHSTYMCKGRKEPKDADELHGNKIETILRMISKIDCRVEKSKRVSLFPEGTRGDDLLLLRICILLFIITAITIL